jgi:hypothetical protein
MMQNIDINQLKDILESTIIIQEFKSKYSDKLHTEFSSLYLDSTHEQYLSGYKFRRLFEVMDGTPPSTRKLKYDFETLYNKLTLKQIPKSKLDKLYNDKFITILLASSFKDINIIVYEFYHLYSKEINGLFLVKLLLFMNN